MSKLKNGVVINKSSPITRLTLYWLQKDYEIASEFWDKENQIWMPSDSFYLIHEDAIKVAKEILKRESNKQNPQ